MVTARLDEGDRYARGMRIVEAGPKVVYILVGGLVTIVFVAGLTLVLPNALEAIVGAIAEATFYLVGVRSFRGSNELLNPSRPWWRMTARPTAGFLIGSLLGLSVVFDIFNATKHSPYELGNVLSAAVEGTLSLLYFNSSVRLRRDAAIRQEPVR
jgi:hypothetical protein